MANRAVRRLNDLLGEGAPRATLTLRGHAWTISSLKCVIRNPLYRRLTTFRDHVLPAPSLIPEVVDPAVVAEADRLLALRAPLYGRLSPPHAAARRERTYGGPAQLRLLRRPPVLGARAVGAPEAGGGEPGRYG